MYGQNLAELRSCGFRLSSRGFRTCLRGQGRRWCPLSQNGLLEAERTAVSTGTSTNVPPLQRTDGPKASETWPGRSVTCLHRELV